MRCSNTNAGKTPIARSLVSATSCCSARSLSQRYRAASYPASYAELVDWLQHYGDEPDAKAIYALAMKRQPDGVASPPRPSVSANGNSNDGNDLSPVPTIGSGKQLQTLLPAIAHRAEALERQINDLAAKDPRRAELLLAGKEAKLLIDSDTRDDLRAAIAEGYLAQGEPQAALTMSASNETAAYAPVADWNAGLAAWRLGRLDEARGHFQALARSSGQSAWVKSAAAFWAARVELKAQRPENYGYWLKIAAENPRTFYGMLARHLMGVDRDPSFDADPFTAIRRAACRRHRWRPARAGADRDRPGRPCRDRVAPPRRSHASSSLLQSLAALADRANLPDVSIRLAGLLGDTDKSREVALYPVPRWEPIGGFTVDRALLYALMRQELQFTPGRAEPCRRHRADAAHALDRAFDGGNRPAHRSASATARQSAPRSTTPNTTSCWRRNM